MRLLISVIVAVYNIEEYISPCIESVLSQSYTNYEIILVNDGSKDGSYAICLNYQKQYPNKIKVINKENGGLSSARNAGLQEAKGEYCYFLDGDDLIDSNTLNNFIHLLDEFGTVDFIHGRMTFFCGGIQNSVIQPYYLDNSWEDKLASGQEMFVNAYKYQKNLQMGVRGLYRKEFLIDNNLLFIERKCSWPEDEEWTPKIFHKAQTCIGTNNADYYYRENRIGSETSKLLNLNTALLTLKIYRDWSTLAKSAESTADFSVALLQEAGNRTINCLVKYSRLYDEELNVFLKEIESNIDIIKCATPYKFVYKVVKLSIKILGMRTTGKLLHVVRIMLKR